MQTSLFEKIIIGVQIGMNRSTSTISYFSLGNKNEIFKELIRSSISQVDEVSSSEAENHWKLPTIVADIKYSPHLMFHHINPFSQKIHGIFNANKQSFKYIKSFTHLPKITESKIL